MATQKTGPTGLSDDFSSEWDAAQTQYQKAIDGGYSPEDAQALYLEPVSNKWNIIKSSPGLLNDPKRLSAFKDDYDKSAQNFQKDYNSYSRDNGAWAFSRTLQPTLQKWQVGAGIPQPPTQEQQIDLQAKQLRLQELENRLDQTKLTPSQRAEYARAKKDLLGATTPEGIDSARTELAPFDDLVASRTPLTPQQPVGATASVPPTGAAASPTASNAPAAGVVPSDSMVSTAPTPPISMVPQPGLQPTAPPAQNIPDLTGQPDAVAQLQHGSVYQMNGKTYRADHASALPSGASMTVKGHTTYGDMSSSPSMQPTLAAPNLVNTANRYVPTLNAGTQIPTIQTQDDHDALKSGDSYYDATGNLRRKS